MACGQLAGLVSTGHLRLPASDGSYMIVVSAKQRVVRPASAPLSATGGGSSESPSLRHRSSTAHSSSRSLLPTQRLDQYSATGRSQSSGERCSYRHGGTGHTHGAARSPSVWEISFRHRREQMRSPKTASGNRHHRPAGDTRSRVKFALRGRSTRRGFVPTARLQTRGLSGRTNAGSGGRKCDGHWDA